VVVVGGYGYPHGWYSPYYGYGYYGWGWGMGWGWGYPYPFYSPWYPYGYPYYYDAFNASLKLEVTPKNAEVYVDGYLAGIVDDFDGVFQRLKVRPGTHEIVLWLEGYRTVQQQLHLATDTGKRIKFAMEALAPGRRPAHARRRRRNPSKIRSSAALRLSDRCRSSRRRIPFNRCRRSSVSSLFACSPPMRRFSSTVRCGIAQPAFGWSCSSLPAATRSRFAGRASTPTRKRS